MDKTKAQLDEAKVIVLQPFQYEEKLNEYIARQSDINSRIEFKELSKQEDTVMEENGGDEPSENTDDEEIEYDPDMER